MGRCRSWTGGKDRRLLTSAGLLLQWIGSRALIKDGRPLLRQQLLIALPGGGSGRGQSGPGGFESSPPHRSLRRPRRRPRPPRRRLPGAGVGAGGLGAAAGEPPGQGGRGPPATAISSAKGVVRRGYPSEVPGTPYMANLRGLLFLCVISSFSPLFLFLRISCQGSGCVNLFILPLLPPLS